jgi:aspartyl protease family protein
MAYSSGVKHFIREATLWVGVALFGFTAVYYFDDLRGFASQSIATVVSNTDIDTDRDNPAPTSQQSTSGFERSVTLKASSNGHFFARAYINGRPIAVMVDTGATKIALTYEDAERLGIRPHGSDFSLTTRTANGTARAAPVTLDDVRIGDVEVSNLRGSIAEPGKLHVTLLGMEFIRKLARFELRGKELILVE